VRFAVGSADFRARGKNGLIIVSDGRHAVEEKSEVGILCKSRELPDTVLSDIDQLLDLSLLKKSKKHLSRLLREADGENG